MSKNKQQLAKKLSSDDQEKIFRMGKRFEHDRKKLLMWQAGLHDRLVAESDWTHADSALLLDYSHSDWLEAYAKGTVFRKDLPKTSKFNNPMPWRPLMRPPRYSDFHHVHFMCPRDLWYKFRSRFPNKGDIQLRLLEAITVYLDLLKESDKRKTSEPVITEPTSDV